MFVDKTYVSNLSWWILSAKKAKIQKEFESGGLRYIAGTSLSQVTSASYAMKGTTFMNIGLHSNLQIFKKVSPTFFLCLLFKRGGRLLLNGLFLSFLSYWDRSYFNEAISERAVANLMLLSSSISPV